ncbi:hypothetical protein PoB_004650900 [Plakobranchus ocellatus]|uniref:Uncharacterized protein n=1 Tax=Plakobranchus ocellatus TaxID=259542 RepID=A0AAV4BM79_9GAST|nr:hypothetical protein PoB_004650900 [Plakobranchus ocellatus]
MKTPAISLEFSLTLRHIALSRHTTQHLNKNNAITQALYRTYTKLPKPSGLMSSNNGTGLHYNRILAGVLSDKRLFSCDPKQPLALRLFSPDFTFGNFQA